VLTTAVLADLVGRDGLLYGAAPEAGLVVFDVQDPAAPIELSRLGLAAGAEGAYALAISGGRAYVVGEAGLAIVDVADPRQPQLLGLVPGVGAGAGDLSLSGTTVLVSNLIGVFAVDVADPANARVVSRLVLPRSMAVDVAVAGHIAVVDHQALVSYPGPEAGMLAVLDLSNPAGPRLMSVVPDHGGSLAADTASSMALVAGSTGPDHAAELRLIDSSAAVDFRPDNGFSPPGGGQDIAVRDGRAFVAAGRQGLHMANVSDPARPRLVASVDVGAAARFVVTDAGNAYLIGEGVVADADATRGSTLSVVDIADPAAPRWLATYPLGRLDVNGFAVRGGRAYLAIGYGVDATPMLRLLDVSGAGATVVGALDWLFGRQPNGVALDGNMAYVTDDAGRLSAVDVTDPAHPRKVGEISLGSAASDLAIAGGTVFVLAEGNRGASLVLVDLARPTNLRRRSSVTLGGSAAQARLAVGADGVWVAGPAPGVMWIDTADLDQPRLRASYRSPGARGVAVDDGHAFLATSDAILWSLGLTDVPCGARCAYLPTLRR
jgi:hypothetical protein